MNNGQSTIRNNLPTWRIFVMMLIVLLGFAIYVTKLFVLQVVQTDEWSAKAAENSTEEINNPSLRGIIYDRNGVVLARNVPSYNVVLTAAELPDDVGATQEIFREVSALIGIPVNLGELSQENPYVPCMSEHGIA